MSRSLEERFGVCGYLVDGAVLRNGTKLKNIRIHKQRSDQMYDLIDPKTNIIYKNLIITGYDTVGNVLNYSLNNDQLMDQIHVDHFFVRGHAQDPSSNFKGFVTKFLYNKVVLSSGRVIYNMYTPECPIYHGDIDNIIMSPISVGDTSVSGILFDAQGPIDPSTMVVTFTTPDGLVFSTDNVVDGAFTISPVELTSEGIGSITVQSDYYDTKTIPVTVLPPFQDSDYVTSILATFTQQPGGFYSATIPKVIHNRGSYMAIQIQENTSVITCDVQVINGDITIRKNDAAQVEVLMIGETLYTSPYNRTFTETNWVSVSNYFTLTIPSSQHLKEHVSFSIYENGNMVDCGVQIDENENITLISNVKFNGNIVIVGK